MMNTRKLLDGAAVTVFAAQTQDDPVRPGDAGAVASTEQASYSRWLYIFGPIVLLGNCVC
jgi:hypothetical protein